MARTIRAAFLGLGLLMAMPALAEEVPQSFLGPIERAVGMKAVRSERHPEFLRIYFAGPHGPVGVEVTVPRGPSPWATRFYLIQPAPDSQPSETILARVRNAVARLEAEPGHAPLVRNTKNDRPPAADGPPNSGTKLTEPTGPNMPSGVTWYPSRPSQSRSWLARLAGDPIPWLQLVFMLALGLLLTRARTISIRLRRIPWCTWLWLGAITATGLALRVAFGAHVPGFISGNGLGGGFVTLRETLIRAPDGVNIHGAAYEAFYGLVTSVLPATEASVLAVQVILSSLSIPLIFALARAWLGHDRPALWAAVALALMPVAIYFGPSEVRTQGGTFFALLGLVVLEQGVRDGRASSLLSAALLTAFAMQFHPVLFAVPAAGVVAILFRARARALLRRPSAWMATACFLAIFGACLVFQLSHWSTDPGSLFGTGFFINPPPPVELFTPDCQLDLLDRSNALLHAGLTPPVWPLLALFGLVWAWVRRTWMVLAALLAALIWTWPGLFIGRLNLGRLQLPALALWAILVGQGAHAFISLIRAARPGWGQAAGLFLAALFVGGLIIWPGPLLTRPTLVAERQLVLEALPQLEAGCAVLCAPEEVVPNRTMPAYLDQQSDARLRWGSFTGLGPVDEVMSTLSCAYYFRSSYCYTVRPEDKRADPLRPVCREIEDQLQLEPAQIGHLPAVPDGGIDYSRKELELGFFRIIAADAG